MISPLYTKSKAFALRILSMSDFLLMPTETTSDDGTNNKSYKNNGRYRQKYSVEVMVKQITRSGTSIAANIAESKYAQSKADLITKLSIAIKESSETSMWLDLLHENGNIDYKMHKSMHEDLTELILMLASSIKTLKKTINDKI